MWYITESASSIKWAFVMSFKVHLTKRVGTFKEIRRKHKISVMEFLFVSGGIILWFLRVYGGFGSKRQREFVLTFTGLSPITTELGSSFIRKHIARFCCLKRF